MKITIGHILVTAMIGGGVFSNGLPSSNWFSEKTEDLKKEYNSLSGLFKSGEEETHKTPALPTAKKDAPSELSKKEVVAGITGVSEQKPPAAPKMVTKKEKNPAKAVKKKSPKKVLKKKRYKKKKVVKKKKPALKSKKYTGFTKKKTFKPKTSPQMAKLVGTYVAMELKTGRVVKGVLQASDKTHHTLEIPGLGPFKYPKTQVKSLKPAH